MAASQVHDELVLEVEESEVEAVREILRSCMEDAVTLSVPMSVDISFGTNYWEL